MSSQEKEAAIAQKVMKELRNPTWNVPDEIQLVARNQLVVGRHPGKSKGDGVKTLVLHSPKLPSMLSRRHALIKYDTRSKCWTVTDLKSLNGVYIDNEKVEADTAAPLKSGNKVCFGVNTDINDLKYEFVSTKTNNTATLRRCGGPSVIVEEIQLLAPTTPPLVKGKRGLREDLCSSNNSFVPKKKPRLSKEMDKPAKTNSRCSLEKDCPTIVNKEERSTCTVGTSKSVSPVLSTPRRSIMTDHIVSSTSAKPSPALSIASTRSTGSEIDELFEGEGVECTAIMDEAIFGEDTSDKESAKVVEERRGLDATALQIKLAQEQMDKEKHKLLSNIEALKSELAAKDQLLAEKEEKTKAAENVNNSVVSSMQEEFTCVICQELFINAYTLPCSHSFCEWCIKEWMKRKGHKDCPICRKKITSDPVHSLALDNAVSKLVEKLSPDEQKERKETEIEHKNALAGLCTRSTKSKKTSISITTGSRVSTRSHTRISAPVAPPPSSSRPIVIDLSAPDRPTVETRPIILDTSTESDSDSEESDSDSEDSDSSDPGTGGAYYGGYGRCFNCGRRGHWAPGCPYY